MMVSRGVLDGGSIKVDLVGNEYKFDVRKGPERAHGTRSRVAARA